MLQLFYGKGERLCRRDAFSRPTAEPFCAVHPWFRSDTRNYRQWQENVAHSVCASVVASRLRMCTSEAEQWPSRLCRQFSAVHPIGTRQFGQL